MPRQEDVWGRPLPQRDGYVLFLAGIVAEVPREGWEVIYLFTIIAATIKGLFDVDEGRRSR